MSIQQSEVYECARNSASVQIDNSEWINDFSGGIKLNKGDSVRILGSFVHEGSSGEEIEITEDTECNVAYSPYIIGATIGTADPTKNLIDIGMYGDTSSSTDAFGIEPPVRIDQTKSTDSNVANYPYPTGDLEAYGNPLATGYGGPEPNKPFGLGRTLFTSQGDSSRTYGTNLKTDSFDPTQRTDNNINLKNYKNFSLRSVPNEFYLANIVKKFILPMNKGHYNENGIENTGTDQISYDWEDLIDNPVDGQPGMFSGVPKVGMCIASCDVGAGSGFYDEEGEAYFENSWCLPTDRTPTDISWSGPSRLNGLPNLKTGVQSMIGTIIAVRPIKHNIAGDCVGCFEIMVSDWVNPAQLVKNGMIKIPMDAGRLTQVKQPYNVSTTAGDYYKHVHGAGELANGYNNNPSWNNINGAYTQMNTYGYYLGMNSSTPSIEGYEQANYEEELVGGAATFPTKFQKGYGMPRGLSFLWNGSHCGGLRFNSVNPSLYDKDTRYRANSVMYWKNHNGAIYSNNHIQDVYYTAGPTADIFVPVVENVGGTPVCYAGYLICNKETMLKVARGEYNILDDPANNYYSAQPNKYPRVWYDLSTQINQSDYKTRHYEGNAWINDAGTDTLSEVANNEYRFGYNMCGQPPNVQWRDTQAATNALNNSLPDWKYPFAGNIDLPMGIGASQTNITETIGDGMPRYYSSPTGYRIWGFQPQPNTGSYNGMPFVWAGYNNCINSVHFQQKETGDVSLGLNTEHLCDAIVHADATAYNQLGGPGTDFIQITKSSIIDRTTGQIIPIVINQEWFISIDSSVNGKASLMIDAVRVGVVNDQGLYYNVGFNGGLSGSNRPHWRLLQDTPAGAHVILFQNKFGDGKRAVSYMDKGAGKDAQPWMADCLMIRQHMTKIQIPNGYYTEEQLAEKINDSLHLNPNQFKKQYGTKLANGEYSVPSTIGNKEQALGSEPSIVNGNFLLNYIPEVSYGFTPITEDNATELNMEASTKNLTNILYTYETLRDGNGDLIFYYNHDIKTLRPYDGTSVKKITDTPTDCGKHVKLYSIPHLNSSGAFNPQVHLIKLKGGAYNKEDFSPPTAGGISVWEQIEPRWAGTYEMLRTNAGNNPNARNTPTSAGIYNYRTRLVRNLISYGGGSKLFCGANNISFSWMEGANRFSLNNLYTPLRPHERDDPNNENQDFSIGDAVPSAVINSKHTGTQLGQLTGIYIDDLNTGPLSVDEWGVPTIGNNYTYDLVDGTEQKVLGQTFLDILGFDANQVAKFSNDFTSVNDPFVFNGVEESGTTIRVGPKITTAINGSNPFASNCLNIIPVAQFFVEVDTDDFFAVNVPLKGNDPYYFIGSDFPSKKFYGNQTGDKLPVIGICSRNFHSFNFVFDLGGSSISYTMEENCTITSIHTKIYTSRLGTPKALSPYSAVIYLITRNNYVKSVPQSLDQNVAQIVSNNASAPMEPMPFYNQPQSNYRTAPPPGPIPQSYFEDDGELPPPPPSPNTSSDDDDY